MAFDYVNMAPDSDVSKVADKGKGKAKDEPKDDKELPLINGKKDEDKKDGMSALPCLWTIQPTDATAAAAEELSEEDQQLKNDLDVMVERLTVRPS